MVGDAERSMQSTPEKVGNSLEYMRNKFIEQVLTALLSTVLVGFVGWLAGFSEMKFDLAQLNKKMDKMEQVTTKTQGDVVDLKLKRMEEDGELKGRLRVIEEQHKSMLLHESGTGGHR